MAERQYTPGLLDRLRGRDPNNPNAPKAPSKPTLDEARRAEFKKNQESKGSKTGDGNIYRNGAGTQQSAQRLGAKSSPAVPSDPRSNLDYSDATELPKSARGKPGYDATAKSKPSTTAGRPSTMPAARKSPETAAKPAPAKQAVTSPAPSSAPKTNPAPASKKSWWDRFSDDHKLSADKSYADYKRLMGDN